MGFDTYCTLYLDTDLEIDELYGRIYSYLGGVREAGHTVVSSWCELSVMRGDHDRKKYKADRTDFVYWRYRLEIDSVEGVPQSLFIDGFNRFIGYLRNFCRGAVPSCDYEDLLNGFIEN